MTTRRTALRTVLTAATVAVAALAMQTPTAHAATTGNWYYLQGSVAGGVGSYAQFGSATDTVLTGDWNGDGRDTLAVRRGNVYYVTNSATGGAAAYSFVFGSSSDQVIVGDWNGDGVTPSECGEGTCTT